MKKVQIMLLMAFLIILIVLFFYVIWLGVIVYQVNRDREDCKHVPISELQDSSNYRYCLELLK